MLISWTTNTQNRLSYCIIIANAKCNLVFVKINYTYNRLKYKRYTTGCDRELICDSSNITILYYCSGKYRTYGNVIYKFLSVWLTKLAQYRNFCKQGLIITYKLNIKCQTILSKPASHPKLLKLDKLLEIRNWVSNSFFSKYK